MTALRAFMTVGVLLLCCMVTMRVETRCQEYGIKQCQCPIDKFLDCNFQSFSAVPTLNRAIRGQLRRLSLVGNFLTQLRDRDVEGMYSLQLLDLRDQRLVSCVKSRLTTTPAFTILGLCSSDVVSMLFFVCFCLFLFKCMQKCDLMDKIIY